MQILLQNPDSTLSIMSLPDFESGVALLDPNYTQPFPTEPQETWRWVNGAVIVDQAALKHFNAKGNVSAAQFRMALSTLGLLTPVNDIVLTLDEKIQVFWNYSTEFHRDNEMIGQVATALGKTQSDLDDVFILAKTY